MRAGLYAHAVEKCRFAYYAELAVFNVLKILFSGRPCRVVACAYYFGYARIY